MRLLLIRAAAGLAALLSASGAWAQCGTSLPGLTLCGNNTGSQGLNQPITNPTIRGPLTVTPTANTLNQALSVTQSGPNSGSTAGPQSYNLLSVTDNNNTITGSGLDAFGILNVNSAAFRVNNTITGSSGTPRYSGLFAVNYTGTGGVAQPVGLMGSVYTNSNPASLWGVIGHAALGPSGSAQFLTGFSAEVSAATGATVNYRSALTAWTEGPVQGSTLDAAFMISTETVAGTPAGFKNVIAIANNLGSGLAALDATANFFSADSATTIANFAKLDNFTITGNIISTPNLTINGTGGAYFGTNTAPTARGLFVSGPSMGVLSLNPSTNTTSGFDYFQTSTSAVDNNLAVMVAEAANTGTFFGQTIGNWAMLRASGANDQGLAIGTSTSKPLILGTNNAARVSINGAGNVMVGAQLTPASGTTLTINQNTGGTPATSSLSNVLGQFIAADSAIGLNLIDTFGAQGFYAARYAGGTQASKSAAGGNNTTFSFGAQAWDGSVYATGAALDFQTTASTWSGSNHGMNFRLRLVADGATALTEAWHTFSTGGFSMAPSGTPIADPGTGNIAATKFFSGTSAGVTCSGPLTVISSITIKGGIITAASGTGGTCS